jgi:diguanylate cyclase (GGDEF)-like protein/PAS domain S-box-containing protein
MYSIDQQARDAAKISLRVLHGEPISSIPIAKNESNRFIFDHLVLQRFGIPLSALPPDSIIKNRQDSMWDLYKVQILAAALVMTVLLILVMVLISVTRRLKTTSLALSHLNVNLETQVQERTAALSQANQTLQLEITERTRIEAALRESEARFRSYFELPLTGRAITSPDQLWLDVNSALCEMLSYTKEELMQMTWGELTYPVDIEADLVQFNRVMAGEIDGYTLEKRFLRKDGGIVHTQLVVQCLRRPDRSIEYFVALIQDINESKRVEEQLRETHDALQTIIYSSPLAILTMDADDRVTMWNPAAEAMFGWSDKQVVGQTDPTVPESKAREYEALRNATLVGMAFSNMDTLRMKKDGTEFPVSLSVAPLRGQQSQVIGRLHVIADITERKKYQEELRQQATTDELTRVSNRRHFIELATNEIKRAVRLKRPPAIALIDIDHFKQINDTYGHAAGDQALVGFTQICQRQIRQIDVFARFGGDEFVVLLPETNQEQAYEVIERIRSTLMAQPLELDGKPVPITISSGIASLSSDQESFEMLLNQADQALYHAKELGRNKVVRSDRL